MPYACDTIEQKAWIFQWEMLLFIWPKNTCIGACRLCMPFITPLFLFFLPCKPLWVRTTVLDCSCSNISVCARQPKLWRPLRLLPPSITLFITHSRPKALPLPLSLHRPLKRETWPKSVRPLWWSVCRITRYVCTPPHVYIKCCLHKNDSYLTYGGGVLTFPYISKS